MGQQLIEETHRISFLIKITIPQTTYNITIKAHAPSDLFIELFNEFVQNIQTETGPLSQLIKIQKHDKSYSNKYLYEKT